MKEYHFSMLKSTLNKKYVKYFMFKNYCFAAHKRQGGGKEGNIP
jgi:hypothetical protein